jgi:phenylpropionate dioxygenase-like ring-hydroxylating dioxygenase large terminal subunit
MVIAAESVLGQSNLLGGADGDRFDVMESWYPVYYLRDLDKAKPAAFTLLDIDLVLWWDRASDAWCAMEDQCPHRLAGKTG